MNLSSLSIHRPVMAMVLSIIIVIFGVVGFVFLGVRDFPSVDPPTVTVTTNYAGANADIIESQITEPLEESINGIAGIRSLTSISSDGRSTITVEFTLGTSMEAAANDVRDRVSRATRNLPVDADPPIVAKADANSDPILAITLQSDTRNHMDLSRVANDLFKERLQTIPGVSEVRIWGEKKYAMKLLLDPSKLAAYGLTPLDVRDALNKENVELPSGRVEGTNTELTLRTLGNLTTTDEFNNLIIKETPTAVIRLKDVGQAKMMPENERTLLRGNGAVPMVGVAITPQPGANYLAIADEFYKRIEIIKKTMPSDLTIGLAIDTTKTISKSILEVEETILIAFGLVVFVIFLFLRNWRTTLIPVIAIPISLIGTFFIMYMFGFSINILTLLGIVLATGLVVDDAIVVLENIYNKIEQGKDNETAGHEGSSEIYFAVISTTITLMAVFLPIIFLQGLTGRLFREFAVVVAGSVLISAFVSLTLTPMMSTRLLKREEESKFFLFHWIENGINKLTQAYERSLRWFFRFPISAIVVMLTCMVGIYFLAKTIPSELAPMEDKSRFMLTATAPEGTSFEKMNNYLTNLIQITDTLPEKSAIIAVTSPGFGGSITTNSGFVRVALVDPEDRKRTQSEIAALVTQAARKYNFAKTYVIEEPTIGGGRQSGLPVQFVIQAPNFERLKEVLPKFMEKAQASSQFMVVDVNLKFNKPELKVEINRDKAKSLGVSVKDVAETLQLLFSGQRYGYFILDGKQYQVIGQADIENRNDPLDVQSVYVRSKTGQMVQLDNVITLTEESKPPQLYRYNRYVSATVMANPAPGVTLGQGIDEMNRIASEVLDEEFSTSLAGTSKEYAESSSSLYYAFAFALVLIYLVLAIQFESFSDPLVIMLTVPLALIGAYISLWWIDGTMNIFSQIGIIVLVGLVTKNGILIVEFANQKKEHGEEVIPAVIDAAVQRLRPILMTSFATILGALPIALALGAAAKSRVPMGAVIVGGLIFSLILTLYIIPVLYSLITKKKV
ncbi:MAG: efflux RND transporter permease subunit [Cytophagaceae bacterium]